MESSLTMGLRLGLIVDRIKITGIGLSKDEYALACEQLPELGWIFKSVYKDSKNKVQYHVGAYKKSIQYVDERKQSIARLEVGTTKMSHRYLAWTLWPHRVRNSNFFQLCNIINQFLPSPPFDYKFAFEHGKVREIELASDFLTLKMHSFIPWNKNARKSSIYDPSGIKGQIKIGGDKSPRAFSIYDKARQLKEKNLPNEYEVRTRIEAKARYTKLSPSNLVLLKNPFNDLQIADISAARNISSDETWHKFLDDIDFFGSAATFASTPKNLRTEFRKKLLLCKACWWNPSNVWTGYKKAIAVLKPSNILA